MRSRWAILAALAVLFVTIALPALAQDRNALAQSGDDAKAGADKDGKGGAGQDDAKAETGSGEDAATPAEPKTGPPWTYQMARIIVALSFLLILAIGGMYYRLIGSRQKGAA